MVEFERLFLVFRGKARIYQEDFLLHA
jgi:hypothetical protein